jgi:hypothetical protein
MMKMYQSFTASSLGHPIATTANRPNLGGQSLGESSVTHTLVPHGTDMNQVAYSTVIGVAVFDLSGLPHEYLTTSDSPDISWVQTIFQALGLRSLLMASLQLDGFTSATICGDRYCAFVVRQKFYYIAFLVHSEDNHLDPQMREWMRSCDLDSLKLHPRFQPAA